MSRMDAASPIRRESARRVLSIIALTLVVLPVVATRAVASIPHFAAAPFYPFDTGILPHSVAIGDLNGDGNPELVTASYSANTVSVLLGHGQGLFVARIDDAPGTEPYAVVVGDLDGTGTRTS